MAAQQKERPLQLLRFWDSLFLKQGQTTDGNVKRLREKEPPSFDY